ncbi:MAG TPA: response regulator [Candidatus Hydrogenedentes bacterium]|nr:response regulator [Candidatus Hydrogenedentota bacterium]HOL76627.1 response regulator [Candidatus Hydrogenedentota bacterium]HPO84460.1 response regulator [Candidatus Hydrogenedentota bacterium]
MNSSTENKIKVLTADDEDTIREFVAAVLSAEGYHVLEARDGDEAVAVAVAELPDVVILDVMMPGRDGVSVFRELRGDPRTSHIPIIMLTSVNESRLGTPVTTSSIAEEMGCAPEAFLEKPIDSKTLLETVREVVSLA